MKKTILNLMAAGAAGWLLTASAQTTPDNNGNNPPPAASDQTSPTADDTNAPTAAPDAAPDASTAPAPEAMAPAADAAASDAAPGDAAPPADNTVKDSVVIMPKSATTGDNAFAADFNPPDKARGTNNPDELRLNFFNAPLNQVLNYLSDAAGFTIVLETQVRGNVSVISSHPMTRNEAVDLLNSVLNRNGYAAIREGQTLTILNKNDAKTSRIPVKIGNSPTNVPNNAEIVTQIIPIRFIDARQLVSDLTSFVSPEATVVANQEGNSIVITDTQANIRHLLEIIRAIDDSAEAETKIQVFPLKYANPSDVAAELASVFPNSNGGAQAPTSVAGRGGRGGRGGGGGGAGGGPGGFFAAMMGGGASGGGADDRIKKATQISAVADARLQAVIVTAPQDLMDQIAEVMHQLDVPSQRDQDVHVYALANGDPQQVAQVLQSMFQSSSSRNNSQNNGSVFQNRTTSTANSMGTATTGTTLNSGSTTGR
jgi:type II secretory pathway component GspD/PulD (secretin)